MGTEGPRFGGTSALSRCGLHAPDERGQRGVCRDIGKDHPGAIETTERAQFHAHRREAHSSQLVHKAGEAIGEYAAEKLEGDVPGVRGNPAQRRAHSGMAGADMINGTLE